MADIFGEKYIEGEPCSICGKISWIYVEKNIENKKKEKIYYCNRHFIDILDKYIKKNESIENEQQEIDLFPEDLHLLDVPIYAAKMQFGNNLPLKYLIPAYKEYLENKLKSIENEIENYNSNSQNNLEFGDLSHFINLLENQKSEILLQIKILEYLEIKENNK
ncbi:MAG: hypothetical protein ACTSRZ_00955 [Promethearchaeota archaeon]